MSGVLVPAPLPLPFSSINQFSTLACFFIIEISACSATGIQPVKYLIMGAIYSLLQEMDTALQVGFCILLI